MLPSAERFTPNNTPFYRETGPIGQAANRYWHCTFAAAGWVPPDIPSLGACGYPWYYLNGSRKGRGDVCRGFEALAIPYDLGRPGLSGILWIRGTLRRPYLEVLRHIDLMYAVPVRPCWDKVGRALALHGSDRQGHGRVASSST